MPIRRQTVPDMPADHVCVGCDVRLRTFCGVLDAQELDRFKHQGGTLNVAADEPLFHEGDRADTVFNLTRGTIKLYKLLPDGRRQVTGFLHPGDFLGIAIDDEHAYSAEAVESSQLCRFSRVRFEAFVESHPRMERELYRLAAHELAAAQTQMLLLGRKTAPERLASFLLALDERRGINGEIDIAMSRLDIADYLGLTKETVSRTFTQFKTGGLIRLLPGDRVRILDRDALKALAEGGN